MRLNSLAWNIKYKFSAAKGLKVIDYVIVDFFNFHAEYTQKNKFNAVWLLIK